MDLKKILPHVIALAVMLIVSMVFFAPNAFRGKVLPQPDNEKAFGMQTEIRHYIDSTGHVPLWTNSAFGGMPSFQIYAPTKNNYAGKMANALILFQGFTDLWAFMFAAMLCMYFLLLALRVDWRVAIVGGLISAVTVYNADIIEAGHSTKMFALALTPGLLAGVVWMMRGRYALGAGMLALFTAMQIYVNHVQITYYTFILVAIYFIIAGIYAVLRKMTTPWLAAVGLAALAVALAAGSNAANLWSTWEYSKETIRGASELKATSDKGDGLSKDYLFGWSYGVGESMTLLIPHFAGGGAGEQFTQTELYKKVYPNVLSQLTQSGTPANVAKERAAQQIATLFYTGDQPFVGTAIYFGAILLFLSLIGIQLGSGQEKWWLLAGGVFMITLAWGKNFGLNNLWYEIMPLFKKFRAVSMALGLSQLCFAALAAIGLQELMDSDHSVAKRQKALYIAGGVILLLLMLGMAISGGAGPNDGALGDQKQLLDILNADRKALVRTDVIRSLLFVLASFGVLFFYLKGKLKAVYGVILVGALALADQWGVATRTLRAEKYVAKPATLFNKPTATEADLQIMQDKDIHYRVLDLSRGSFTSNAMTSFFHKSLSGYHAAKLQRFQEVVDKYLGEDLVKNLHIIGMLNGKYIIGQGGQVMPNDQNCGDAWFVNEVQTVANADEELNALGSLNPKQKVVVQAAFAEGAKGISSIGDSLDQIVLSSYAPDHMVYTYSASSDRFAVFSEMYYPPSKGWKVYLNGQPYQDFIKVNYLVRGLKVPAGKDVKLEMRFEPKSFLMGEQISLVASILTLLLFGAGLFLYFRQAHFSTVESIADVEPAKKEALGLRAPEKTTKPTKPNKR